MNVGLGYVTGALALSLGLSWTVVACTSFGSGGSDSTDADAASPSDASVDPGRETSVSDSGTPDAAPPGPKCTVRTVASVSGVLTVQRYLDKLYFADSTTVYVCDAANCTPQILAKGERDVRSLTVGAGYAFWLAAPALGSVVRRMSLGPIASQPSTVSDGTNPFVSLRLTNGPMPQLVLMGSHLYRASPGANDFSGPPDIIEFYYAPAEVALTSVGNRVLYNHPTAARPGPHVCAEGTGCALQAPVVDVKANIAALHVDQDTLYYAIDAELHRATIGALVDGGPPAKRAPFATFQGNVQFVESSGAELAVLSKDALSVGRVGFGTKTDGTFGTCPTTMSAPTSATADGDEIFVAAADKIVAYHR